MTAHSTLVKSPDVSGGTAIEYSAQGSGSACDSNAGVFDSTHCASVGGRGHDDTNSLSVGVCVQSCMQNNTEAFMLT